MVKQKVICRPKEGLDMTANLYVKNGIYHVMLPFNKDGKRSQKSVTTGILVKGNNKRKAEDERRRILNDWVPQITENNTEVLFSEYLKQWLEDTRLSIADTTYHSYKQTIENVICPFFAERKVMLSNAMSDILSVNC
jgi:hypothetical protein